MNSDTASSLTTLVICGIVLFVLALLLATPAVPATLCLSKKEARELWPRSHLYWYSRDHCWSNRRGPPRGLRLDPVVNHTAQKKIAPAARAEARDEEILPECCWPRLEEPTPYEDVIEDRPFGPWEERIGGAFTK